MRLLRSLHILLIVLGAYISIGAQTATTGTIEGIVTDSHGAVVPGITITASGVTLIRKQSTVTNTEGHYWILNLPPGRYLVRSEEHTSELQSRFGISYAVFCLKK